MNSSRSTRIAPAAIHRHVFTVSTSDLDVNGHVNNVVYVQWMQDVAILHFDAVGGSEVMRASNAIWVARSHKIEYLKPAFAGDEALALTWVADYRRVRSLRRYRFLRKHDKSLLAEGETDWIFVDAVSGRPKSIPDEIQSILPIADSDAIKQPS